VTKVVRQRSLSVVVSGKFGLGEVQHMSERLAARGTVKLTMFSAAGTSEHTKDDVAMFDLATPASDTELRHLLKHVSGVTQVTLREANNARNLVA